jgi:hypothetical protein
MIMRTLATETVERYGLKYGKLTDLFTVCYNSCIVTPHSKLILPINVYGIYVLEPGMTISYLIRHLECDLEGRGEVH